MGQVSRTPKKNPDISVFTFLKKEILNHLTLRKNYEYLRNIVRPRENRNIHWARHVHKTAVALSSPRARAACDVGPRVSVIFSDRVGRR